MRRGRPCWTASNFPKAPDFFPKNFDANGNLTGDGTRTFEWDAENRLVAVNSGTHRSEFTYDGKGRRIRIVEKDNGVVTSDRRFVWCGMVMCEERDGTGSTVTRRFFDEGLQDGGASFFYAMDHLGSVRELTDSVNAIRARYDYDPFGRTTKLTGDKDALFGFTGHFLHTASGLYLAPRRAYDPALGRWISEDPIGLDGGINFFAYVLNDPVASTDPSGLLVYKCTRQSNGFLFRFTNHVYFCNPATGQNCGKGSQSGSGGTTNNPKGGPCQIPPPPGVACVPIPGTNNPTTVTNIFDCCNTLMNVPWIWVGMPGGGGFPIPGNNGFFPWVDDCHTYVGQCLSMLKLPNPQTPGGRFGCRTCGT